MNSPAPNWYPDPYGRYQYRYFDGASWTAHVVDGGGNQSTDAAPLAPAGAGAQQASGGWGQPAPQQGRWGGQPQPGQGGGQPQQQPGAWGQPQQQPQPGQWGAPTGQQPPGAGFGGPPPAQSPPSSSQMTQNFVGTIIAGVGAVVAVIGLFALDWVSAGDQGISRGDLSDVLSDANDMGADVNFLPDTFFSFGWIIALVVALGTVAAALVKLPPLRIAAAALAGLCAIWVLGAAFDNQVSGEGAGLAIGVWVTAIGLVAAAAGALVALVQDAGDTAGR